MYSTHDHVKDRELLIQEFPINRHISNALEMFGELEEFVKYL